MKLNLNIKSDLKQIKITTNKGLGFASFFHCKSLKYTFITNIFLLYILQHWKLTQNIFFSSYYSNESENTITMKENFELMIYQELIALYQAFILILFVHSKTIQDIKFSVMCLSLKRNKKDNSSIASPFKFK